MRLNRNLPPKTTQKENLKIFYEAIASLQNAGEVEKFLTEFLTPAEQRMLAQRVAIAHLLMGNLNYSQIANRLKVSRGTIARVNRWLKYGAGGYRLVLGVYGSIV